MTDSWIYCNDNRIKRCPSNEVVMVQAYIMFYARQRGCSPVLKDNTINYECVTSTPAAKRKKYSYIE